MKSKKLTVEDDWPEIVGMFREMLNHMHSAADMHRSVQVALLKRCAEELALAIDYLEMPTISPA